MSTEAPQVLAISDLVAGYGRSHVLHGVSLELRRAEAVAIVGPNGAGKSTLFNVVSGLLNARSGTVTVDGRDLTNKAPHVIVRNQVIQVPEGRQVFPTMTVKANLRLGAFAAPKGAGERLEAVLEIFPRLRERLEQSSETLSGGEQQMLAIGRGLMAAPKVLMLDEPTLGLAPIIVGEVLQRLKQARAELNTTLLVAEQNAYLAKELCDRFYVLRSGQIVHEGEHMPSDPAELLAHYLGTEDEAAEAGQEART